MSHIDNEGNIIDIIEGVEETLKLKDDRGIPSWTEKLHFKIEPLSEGFILSTHDPTYPTHNPHTRALSHRDSLDEKIMSKFMEALEKLFGHGNTRIEVKVEINGYKEDER